MDEMHMGDITDQFACYTSVKIRSKLDLKRKKGEFIGAFAPFGYEKQQDNNDILVIDRNAAQTVREIFAWYTRDAMSLGAIVRRLNASGVPNPTMYKNAMGQKLKNPSGNDGLWSASSVRRILSNEVYLGKMVQGREETADKLPKPKKAARENRFIVPGTHEPIVDFATFQAARTLLEKNAGYTARRNVYPLGGLIKCGECGKAMSRKASKERGYYCCRTYREKGRQFCRPHSMREDILFSATLEAINRHIACTGGAQALLARVLAAQKESGPASQLSERLCKAEKELANEITVFDKTYYDYAAGSISGEQFKRIRELCEKRQQTLTILVAQLTQELEDESPQPEDKPEDYSRLFEHDRAVALTRWLAQELLETVTIYSDSTVVIRFKDPQGTPETFFSENGVKIVVDVTCKK